MLDNPGGRPIPFDSPYMILSAMYGDLTLEAPVLADGVLGDFRNTAGRNGSKARCTSWRAQGLLAR